ncbi:MAG: MarR family transcriptional regulator [Candidatus Hodarchaeales archaeon]
MSNEFGCDDSDLLRIMAPSVQQIYSILSSTNALLISDIINISSYSRRTIQQALKVLIEARLVKQQPDLKDLRRKYFMIT